MLSHILLLHCPLAITTRIEMDYSDYVKERILYYCRFGRSYEDIIDYLAKIGLKTTKSTFIDETKKTRSTTSRSSKASKLNKSV